MVLIQYSDIPFEIFTIDGIYTDAELSSFLDYVNDADITNRKFTNSEFKNGKVLKPIWSSMMYERVKEYLPNEYVDRQCTKWSPVGCPASIMYAKIQEGQLFSIHTDTGCEYDDTTRKYSKFTFFTYLNDDYGGGTTQFYTDSFKKTYTITPKRNRTLFFDIDLFHSGERIERGCKYWIGSELVCKKL